MEITVKSNKSKRTYTIAYNGGKFRTSELSKPEFQELDFNTNNDWYNYLRNNEVTKIK